MNSEKTQLVVPATTGLIATAVVMFVLLARALERTDLLLR